METTMPLPIEEGLRLLAEYLTDALNAFHLYEELHAQKETPEGDEKARRNAALALRMEEGLALLNVLQDQVRTLPARVAELEEALRPFAPTPEVLQAIQYIHDSGELYLGENGWQIGPITAGDLRRAASLLSASTPASEPGADVVERVAK